MNYSYLCVANSLFICEAMNSKNPPFHLILFKTMLEINKYSDFDSLKKSNRAPISGDSTGASQNVEFKLVIDELRKTLVISQLAGKVAKNGRTSI